MLLILDALQNICLDFTNVALLTCPSLQGACTRMDTANPSHIPSDDIVAPYFPQTGENLICLRVVKPGVIPTLL
jgi:hypothetical protein